MHPSEAAEGIACDLGVEDDQSRSAFDAQEGCSTYDSRKELASLVVRLRAKNVFDLRSIFDPVVRGQR